MTKKLYQKIFDDLEEMIMKGDYCIGSKLPSENELAKKYDVSSITIKRALQELNNLGYISRKPKQGTVVISVERTSDTALSIERILPVLGYILTNFDDTFGTKILSSILENATNKAHIIVKKSMGDLKKEEELIQELLEVNIDGIILLPCSSKYLSPNILELIYKNFPIVILDRTLEGIPISSITTNNRDAMEQLTSYLISTGHRNIGMITSTLVVSSIEERIQGYIHSHASHQIKMNHDLKQHFIRSVIPNSSASIEKDIQEIISFIQANSEITALIASEYNIALLIKQACEQIGKKIPEDISIACFDHPDHFFDKQAFQFTHINQNQYELGKESLNQILEQIKNPSSISKKNLPGELKIGQSTRR